MSTREQGGPSKTVESRDELVAWLAAGEKPKADWRIGTEHEKFVFDRETLEPVPYEGDHGIRALMTGLMACCGWEPVMEDGNIIALKLQPGQPGGNVSLEPGGQFELSGAPLTNLHQTAGETDEHLSQFAQAGGELNLGALGIGFTPTWRRDEVPSMPKKRYGLMTSYMPKMGKSGLDMMYRTATIQTNLDFSSEADMVAKTRVSLALQPIATALFAASPFTDGKPNGFKSMRSEVWRDTDPDRTGMLPFVFEDGMGYEAYADYAIKVPMYFVYRDGEYIDVTGASFQDFLDGRLAGFEGQRPTIDDWSDHLTTLFPEVRLKRFLEMRGGDGGGFDMICAFPAFWTGLLYDADCLQAAWDLVRDWTEEERQRLRDEVPRLGFAARIGGRTVGEIASQAVDISAGGLQRRGFVNVAGDDERKYLEPLRKIVDSGIVVADRLLRLYENDWKGNIAPVFEECRF